MGALTRSRQGHPIGLSGIVHIISFSTFSITPGKGQCAAARSRMREGRGGILFVADTRSRRNSQKETPSLRQVFLRLAKVSRQRRPRSLRVPPLTFRFLT